MSPSEHRTFQAGREPELAPYACQNTDSRGRVHPEPEHPYRSPAMRDRDRIIHSTAFRRLEYKTQVFVNHEGDYYRTRLTHTMEVAQISRSLARALGLNEDLTEAIALAHDLGHTPFGHSGEEALNALMAEDGGFEHNRHGLRVVDHLEQRYPDFPGLNLTWEVREGIIKHRTQYDHAFVGSEFEPEKRPTMEAQVVDVADIIAYDSHDVDDGLKSGIIQIQDIDEIELWKRAVAQVHNRYGTVSGDLLRVQAVRFLIDLEVSDVLEETRRRIGQANPGSMDDVRNMKRPLVALSGELQPLKKELEDFLMSRLYRHHRVVRMATKAARFVRQIFEAYAQDPRQLPPAYQKRIEALCSQWTVPANGQDEQQGLERKATRRVVCDYIAGMTDRFALDEYLKLYMPYERV